MSRMEIIDILSLWLIIYVLTNFFLRSEIDFPLLCLLFLLYGKTRAFIKMQRSGHSTYIFTLQLIRQSASLMLFFFFFLSVTHLLWILKLPNYDSL